MALISCPECGKQISDTTPSCPHCGYRLSINPVNKTIKLGKIVIVAAVVLSVIAGMLIYSNEKKSAEAMQTLISVIETTISSDHEIKSEKNKITVDFWSESLHFSVDEMKTFGFKKDTDVWVKVKESYITICNAIKNVCKSYDRSDVTVIVNLKNTRDDNETLCIITDGILTFDALDS